MITVQTERCNGCGACVESCPNGAILLQNGVAFISQDLCQECETCLDVCSQGALVYQEQLEPVGEVIRIPAPPPVLSISPQPAPSRGGLLSAVGTFLLWTGKEWGPRLAEIALNYLYQRIHATEPSSKVERISYAERRSVNQARRSQSRGRRHRRR